MHRLLAHPVARFVALTAVLGSLADWTLFAALVARVDGRTQGTPWATALVLFARVAPATVFAPMAARRIDGADLRKALLTSEAGRVLAVGALTLMADDIALVLPLVMLVGLEFAAAMLAAGRESLISRDVPADLHTSMNTWTAVASYGLLPFGALAVQLLGHGPAMLMSVGMYALVMAAYAVAWPAVDDDASAPRRDAKEAASSMTTSRIDAGLRRTILAAALGLAPIVAMFTVAPRLAAHWLGASSSTAMPIALIMAGGAVGFVLVNRGAKDSQGLLVAGAGFVLSATPVWFVGLGLVGIGAGVAYLALQTRLQSEATDPSQFASAFAILKVATILGALAGPAVWTLAGPRGLLLSASVASVGATALVADLRPVARRMLAWVVRRVVRVEVVGERCEGPMVVVSNHPNAIDGVLALAVDLELRPVARWQRHPLAKAGIWLADAVVTTARTDRSPRPALAEATSHLQAGGRVWLAPEGGAQPSLDLVAPRSGAVRMAAAAGVPMQALGIIHHGDRTGPVLRNWRPWRRPAVTMAWGALIHATGDVAQDNDRMMTAIAKAAGMRWDPTVAMRAPHLGGQRHTVAA